MNFLFGAPDEYVFYMPITDPRYKHEQRFKKELTLMWSYCRDLYVCKHEKDDVCYDAI